MALSKILSKGLKKVRKKKPSIKTLKEKAKAKAAPVKSKTSTTKGNVFAPPEATVNKRAKVLKDYKAGKIKIAQPSSRDIQTKVLEKAKKNNMTSKNFRMQNPKDKDVQALYKANPNIKNKDVDRLKTRKLEEKGNKKLVTTPRGKFIQKVNKITGVSYRAQELGIPYEVDSAIFRRVEKGGGTLAERAKKYMDALNRYAKNKKKKK